MRDEPNMSDTTLLLTVEDLINIASGPSDINRVNFKMMQKVLHILAGQMRMLEKKVEIRDEELKKPSTLRGLSVTSKVASMSLSERMQSPEESLIKKISSEIPPELPPPRSRSESLEIVTREQFVVVRDKVRALLDRAAIPYDLSAFEDKRKKKSGKEGQGSGESASLSLRSDRPSAQSASKATLIEILSIEQLTARMGAVEKTIDAMAEMLTDLAGAEGDDDDMPKPGEPLVSKPYVEQCMKKLREELVQATTDMGVRANDAADSALKAAKTLRARIDSLTETNQRVDSLQSLVEEYSTQLSGFDEGLTAQITNFQDQLKQTKEDLESGIKRLELACTNAEKAALVELKGNYEELQADQEFLIAKHGDLTVSRKRLEEDLMSIVQCVENLREQKADRDEVLDGLRDKATISQLGGLLSENRLEETKEEFTKRLEMCHQKFAKQDAAWQELLKELSLEVRQKAGIGEMLNVQERARAGLQELHNLLRDLSVVVGEPKAAVLTRKLAKDAYCGVCKAPAFMAIENDVQCNCYPALRAKPLHIYDKGDSVYDFPPAPEPRSHVCHRWCGGSHTMIGRPPHLTRTSAHYMVDMLPQERQATGDHAEATNSATDKLARAGAAAATLVAAYSDPRSPNVEAGTKALRALAQLVSAVVKDVKGCGTCYSEMELAKRSQLADALCEAADALCRAASSVDLEKINASALVFGDAFSNLLYFLDRDKPGSAKLKCPCYDDEAHPPTPNEQLVGAEK